MPVGLVIVVLLKLKTPSESLVMSMPASPPASTTASLNVYVPSASSNWRPVPLVAVMTPASVSASLNVTVPVCAAGDGHGRGVAALGDLAGEVDGGRAAVEVEGRAARVGHGRAGEREGSLGVVDDVDADAGVGDARRRRRWSRRRRWLPPGSPRIAGLRSRWCRRRTCSSGSCTAFLLLMTLTPRPLPSTLETSVIRMLSVTVVLAGSPVSSRPGGCRRRRRRRT